MAQVAQQRLATLQAIQNQRMVLLQRRENLSQQIVPIQNQLKVANGQATALMFESGSIRSKLQQLTEANNQLLQQRQSSPFLNPAQAANIDAIIAQNTADGRALEVQLGNVESQLAGVSTTISGLKSQLADAAIAVSKLYDEADQLRIEWLRLMDPFGRLARAEHQTAILIFTEWIVLDGENSGAFLARGIAFWRLNEFDKALADFDRAIKLGGPIAISALAARGGLRHAMGKRRDGLADLGRALKLDKADGFAYLIRAQARIKEGNFRMALSDLQVASRLKSSDPNPHQQLALLLAACPQKSIRNGKKALESAKLACKLANWEDWSCLEALAAAHAEMGQFDEAVKWQTKAVTLAVAENREKCEEHLTLYNSGKPFRIQLADDEAQSGPI